MKCDFTDRRIIKSSPGEKHSGWQLIDYLCARFDYRERDAWCKAVENGEFLVDGDIAVCGTLLTAESEVQWLPPEDLPEPQTDNTFEILWQDSEIIAVNKSGNLPTHPAGAYFHNTLWWLLRMKYGAVFPVNRLDRETSGIVLFARNAQRAAELQNKLPEMRKEYILLVEGEFPQHEVTVHGWIRRDTASAVRKKQMLCNIPCGKEATTVLRRIDYRNGISKLLAMPLTGRMHQIRLAVWSLGYPVVGDKLYGVNENFFVLQKEGLPSEALAALRMKRQALHASLLVFPHPDNGETITVCAPQPNDFLF